MFYCTLCPRPVEYGELLYLRRHLLVRHQHEIVDDEVVAVPSRFLGLSLREVGLSDGTDPGVLAVRLTASQHRRRQRERSDALGNRRQGGSDREGSTVYVRRVQAEATASASAGCLLSSPGQASSSSSSMNVKFDYFLPELSTVSTPPAYSSVATMTELKYSPVASQTPSSFVDMPTSEQRRDIAELVVSHPTAGIEEVLRLFCATRREFYDVEVHLLKSTIRSRMMSAACLAQRIRVEVAGHFAHPETAAVNLRGTWYSLGEYVDRSHL